MKYKLRPGCKNNIEGDYIKDFFESWGIKDYKNYMFPTRKFENNYLLLDDIEEARDCFLSHIQNNDEIAVIVDHDCDGYCSSAELMSYVTKDLNYKNIHAYIHQTKIHGIQDLNKMNILDTTKLIIIPDAGTNDIKECKALKDKGIDVIILDHHDLETGTKLNPYAIVVNNQTCNYPNKQLCGAAIVYKFLQCLDDYYWTENADKYIDLVAIALIADSMKLNEYETRYYVYSGLKYIKNKQILAFMDNQKLACLTVKDVSYKIVNLINAMIRYGTYSNRLMLLESLCENYREFDYRPPKSTETIKEDIYNRVYRFCYNTKQRQDKERDKAIDYCKDFIEKHNLLNKEKVLFLNLKNQFNSAVTGLVAIKISEEYNRPTVILNPNEEGFKGSVRNVDSNCIRDTKAFMDSCHCEWNLGHPQAFGTLIKDVPGVIKETIKKLRDKDFGNEYLVDYIIDYDEYGEKLDDFIQEVSTLKPIYGNAVKEPMLVITNIRIKLSDLLLIGKKSDTIKFIKDDVEFVKFKCKEDDELLKITSGWVSSLLEYKSNIDVDDFYREEKIEKFISNNKTEIVLDIVGECDINEYKGSFTDQIKIKDYNIKSVDNK